MSYIFDKRNIYTEEIEPLIDKLKLLCRKNKLPLFIAVGVKNTEESTVYKKEAASPTSLDIQVTDDIIPDLVNITLGFDAVPHGTVFNINIE